MVIVLGLFTSPKPLAKSLSSAVPRATFQNIIDRSGLDYHPGFGGIAWSDFNGDRKDDIFIATATGNKLYQGNGDGTFIDVTRQAGIAPTPVAFGVVFGDYDNDGCPDLYLSIGGPINSSKDRGIPDSLYHNNCDGTFTDVIAKSGMKDIFHGTGATWFDYDNDGWLDLYVANYGVWKNDDDWTFEPNILYHNNGNGTFTAQSELDGAPGLAKCSSVRPFPRYPKNSGKTEKVRPLKGWKESFQPISFDFDNDGKQDLFIATDYGVSPLYHNNGNGTFSDVTEQAGMCVRGSGMGVTAGDYDNNGYLDLYVTNGDHNFLWHNNGNGTFSETSEEAGVANFGSLGWGAQFFDYNNDGALDLYEVSGNVLLDAEVRRRYTNRQDRLYENNGQGHFTDIAIKAGLSGNDPKLAAAFADINNDGFTDLFVISDYPRRTDNTSHNRLYLNTPNGNHWLSLRLVGDRSNRDAVGARISLTVSGKTQIREITVGTSYISQNSLRATFGLGKATHIEKLQIQWPSGQKQTVTDPDVDHLVTVTESH